MSSFLQTLILSIVLVAASGFLIFRAKNKANDLKSGKAPDCHGGGCCSQGLDAECH